MRTSAIPKTIQKWIDKNPEIVDEYWMEDSDPDEYGDWSIWLYFKYGYINTCSETHCIHESTVKDFFAHVKCIEKCECEECLANLEKKS